MGFCPGTEAGPYRSGRSTGRGGVDSVVAGMVGKRLRYDELVAA